MFLDLRAARAVPVAEYHRRFQQLALLLDEKGFSEAALRRAYGSARNARLGREWVDLMMEVRGEIAQSMDSVFAVDWYNATGENLFSMQDARNLIRYGGMRSDRDWLQFDCALSYGLVEYLRTLDVMKHGSPVRTLTADRGATVKTLWTLHDGVKVESVLMRYKERTTLCVSSPAACRPSPPALSSSGSMAVQPPST